MMLQSVWNLWWMDMNLTFYSCVGRVVCSFAFANSIFSWEKHTGNLPADVLQYIPIFLGFEAASSKALCAIKQTMVSMHQEQINTDNHSYQPTKLIFISHPKKDQKSICLCQKLIKKQYGATDKAAAIRWALSDRKWNAEIHWPLKLPLNNIWKHIGFICEPLKHIYKDISFLDSPLNLKKEHIFFT